MKLTRTALPLLAATAALVLAGCSSPEPAPSPSAPSSSAEQEVFATDLAAPVDEALAGFDEVSAVEQTSDVGVEINTSIVDPRGDDDSPEAVRALEVCQAAAAVDGVEQITVNEADGTGFAVLMPNAGNLGPSGECFEY